MNYLFVVQGEGRGHFTQALSLKNMLEKNGHNVVGVMVGSSSKRVLPDFFTDKIKTELIRFQSPNFLPVSKTKKSFLIASIIYNLLLVPTYIASLFKIRKTIKAKKPDVVVNFYELLCGITYGVFNPDVPMINVAHQYYFLTPEFHYTGKNRRQFDLLNFYTEMTALNSTRILALSFRNHDNSNYGNISIVPPLIRPEVFHQKVQNGNYIHGYLLNSGYAKEIAEWSECNLYEQLHFFWDKKNVDTKMLLAPRLVMHALNDSLFIQYMAGCKGFATTGGFESVCEAMYLQKPVLMVPSHIEQECNVIDALNSNAGVTSNSFNLYCLLDFIPKYSKTLEFKFWVHTAESHFLYELTEFDYLKTNLLVTT